MGNTELTETESPSLKERRNRRTRRKRVAVTVALVLGIVVVGVTVAGTVYWRSLSKKNQVPTTQTSGKIIWRLKIFARKAEGGIPELSWKELWQMARQPGGFGLEGLLLGQSVQGTVRNKYVSAADMQAASRMYDERCGICHGNEGVGGEHGAPSLNHPGLRHGDSDLAIYKVLKDGVPNTAMPATAMSMVERWQLVGFVRHLQLHHGSLSATNAALNIQVSKDQLFAAGSKTDGWLTYSGTLDGRRYTALNQITPANVSQLRIRWVRQFDTTLPTIESTPLVAGGVIFVVDPPSETTGVEALDAKSGDLLWKYGRSVLAKVPSLFGRVNRGLAILNNELYFTSLDGYLVCINANSGNLVWETKVADPSNGFSLSMAPLIVNRSVIVGVAGGEYGIRGFLASYDSETGAQQWKFNTIPGPGEPGHETWSGDAWKTGGGSTWVTGSYDSSLDLLYWGIGNPSPDFSGNDRPGDNLYSESVIALHGSTGQLAWHFQFTPHDVHDWDSTETPILADIPIKGQTRKVICFANRNGFYYVLDRVTGEFLTGVPFVEETWAKGLDSAGRPILSDAGELSSVGRVVRPGLSGGTNFQNAAIDVQRGLVFVPATEGASVFTQMPHAVRGGGMDQFSGSAGSDTYPPVPVVRALDAASGAKKWERYSPAMDSGFFYSGLLATGGGLVFGASGGSLFAIESSTGREVWRVFLGGDTRAAPISFTVEGKQVIAVSAGRSLFLFGL